MRCGFSCAVALGIGMMLASPTFAATIYNNLTPNNQMALTTRPESAGKFEIETADDFALTSQSIINSASFVGLLVPGTGGSSISNVVVEMYRIFPLDSNTARTPNVPTRANSPSDVAFDSRDSIAAQLTFSMSVLNPTFTALNSVQPGGIHPSPLQMTQGNGPITGQEVQVNVTLTLPFNLPADHYFFVPQVEVTDGGEFYWLSASRPIAGTGTTPFPTGITDLQVWTRDAMLDPDWLRAGTDIVGGTNPPTFNAAFSLDGTAVPEPSSIVLSMAGLVMVIGLWRFRRQALSKRF